MIAARTSALNTEAMEEFDVGDDRGYDGWLKPGAELLDLSAERLHAALSGGPR